MDFETVWGDGALGCAALGTSNDDVRHASYNPEDEGTGMEIWGQG
jgi:hypothetical protein